MIGHGKCPKCQDTVIRCDLDQIIVGNKGIGPFFHGVSMCCPRCGTVLGVSVDPSSLVADIVDQVAKRIQGRTR